MNRSKSGVEVAFRVRSSLTQLGLIFLSGIQGTVLCLHVNKLIFLTVWCWTLPVHACICLWFVFFDGLFTVVLVSMCMCWPVFWSHSVHVCVHSGPYKRGISNKS